MNRRPRIPESRIPLGLEGASILIHYNLCGSTGSFVGRCFFRRRRADDRILMTVRFPNQRPEAFRYWKFIWWLDIAESDLASLRRPLEISDTHSYELDWIRQNEPPSE